MASRAVKAALKYGGMALGGYYLVLVWKMFRALRARRRLVLSYSKERLPPLSKQLVSNEEFEAGLKAFEEKVTNPALGLMSSASPITHEIIRESVPFTGGGMAALLQAAHPYVAQGIVDHSEVLTNPLGRFQKTFHFVFRIYYGDLETALRASRTVRRIHNRIFGTLSESSASTHFSAGEDYTAHNREAIRWVNATLLETNLFLFELMVRPLSMEEKSQALQDFARGSVMFGSHPSEFPSSYEEFQKYYFSVCSSVLKVTEEGQKICNGLMVPILWEKHLPGPNSLKTVTGVLLPEPLSKQYGFDAGIGAYIYSASLLALIKMVYLCLPGSMRYLTAYLEAQARAKNAELPYQSKLMAKLGDAFINAALGPNGLK